MNFYGVVSARLNEAVELFQTRQETEAEAMLADVLNDEPDWRDLLYVEPIEFMTRGLN
jgi:hypothetical protein